MTEARRRLRLPWPVDLPRTVFALVRGSGDPTTRVAGSSVWRAVRTADGPATIHLQQLSPTEIELEAAGEGADHAVQVEGPGAAGAFDDAGAFQPLDGRVAEMWRRRRGVLLTRADPFPVLVAAILEQKVTGLEARRAWRAIVRRTAEPAPGSGGLLLPPDPERLLSLPSWELHRVGVVHRRATALRGAARHGARVTELAGRSSEDAKRFLRALPGVGPWTVAEVTRTALGDPDAVSVGDFHLPNLVCWTLADEPRGDDARMLELIEPYRGQRGRLQLLLEAGGAHAPAFGPKLEPRSFA
jgi:3-methyladenine DNA glycosylase/8-oxoguanine DNA glycosylase